MLTVSEKYLFRGLLRILRGLPCKQPVTSTVENERLPVCAWVSPFLQNKGQRWSGRRRWAQHEDAHVFQSFDADSVQAYQRQRCVWKRAGGRFLL